jgi:pilus assembly protein CpaE
MRTLIVSNDLTINSTLREILVREGYECLISSLPPREPPNDDQAGATAELLIVVLSPEPELALAFLRQARQEQKRPILAVGPADDAKLILRVLREGATQYLDQANLPAELDEAIAKLRAEGVAGTRAGKLICLLAATGGSGSTTVAVNLATILAQIHKSCLLFDLKPGVGDLEALLDLRPTHTLADLCASLTPMDRVMLERSLSRHPSGVHLLAPPRTVADISRVVPQAVGHALTISRSLFPYVVADLDDCFHEEQVQALRLADTILLVFRLEFTSLRNTRRLLEHLTDLGIRRDLVHLVANRCGQPKELPPAKAEDALGVKIYHYIPDEPRIINKANNNGIPAVIEDPNAGVCKSIRQLAVNLNGRHES